MEDGKMDEINVFLLLHQLENKPEKRETIQKTLKIQDTPEDTESIEELEKKLKEIEGTTKDIENKNKELSKGRSQIQEFHQKLKEKLDPNCIGLDYGAFKSHFSSINKGEIKTTPENSPFESVIRLGFKSTEKGGKFLTASLLNQDKNRVYSDHQLLNIVYHLKNKLGYQLVDKKKDSHPKQLNIHTETKTYQVDVNIAFKKSITTFFNEYKHYPFLKPVLNDKTDILVSHPNHFSLNQIEEFKKSFKDSIPSSIPNWKGDIYLYSESECALFSLLKDIYLQDTIIIDQGDSTTNVTSAIFKIVNGKLKISLYHDGMMIGGSNYSQIVQDLIEDSIKRKLSLEELYFFKRNSTNIKISLLKNDQNEIYESEIKGTSFTIKKSNFESKCEEIFKKLDDFITSHITKTGIIPLNIIFTGGGFRNILQRKYLEKYIFYYFIEKGAQVFSDNLEKRVVEGLHYRHAIDKVGGIVIEEASPYSIYILSRSEADFKLKILLPKGMNCFKSFMKFEKSKTNYNFPFFQVNSTQDDIPLKGNEELEVLEIGNAEIPCNPNNHWSAEFFCQWEKKKVHLKLQDEKKKITKINFEMNHKMRKVEFGDLIKEYK